MARRKHAAKRKNDPVPLTLSFTAPLAGDNYIDLSMCASAVSRKFFRQGLDWAVSHFTITAVGNLNGTVTVSKCPQTWMASNAWHKSYATWNRQQKEAVADGGSQSALAKYRDFKVHLDSDMVGATLQTSAIAPVSGQMLIPYDNGYNLVNTGEWEYSQIVIPNIAGPGTAPGEYYLHLVGDNSVGGSRGIIDGYASSRSYPQSPEPVSPAIGNFDNWMRDMFDVGSDSSAVTENATETNDDLPYDQVNYPGAELNFPDTEVLGFAFINNGATTSIGQATIQGSNFPCGLIKLSSSFAGDAAFYNIQVHLVPGSHRGYLAEPMQGM